jgi:hypothetical protein
MRLYAMVCDEIQTPIMPAKSVTLHVRIPPSVYELLKAKAKTKHWSVAGAAAIMLEEALTADDRPADVPPPLPPEPPTPVVQVLLGPQRDVDRFLAIVRQTMATHGFAKVANDGTTQRMVQLSDVRPAFYVSRGDDSPTAKKAAYHRGLNLLIDRGVAVRDGDLISLAVP